MKLPRSTAAFGAWLVTLAACGADTAEPRPQWTVVLATDAPVPQFGDRLLLELYGDDGMIACSGCRRQMGVGKPSAWPVSFGIVAPENGSRPRIRARLYRTARTESDGLPAGDLLLDAYAKLPPTDTNTRVVLQLGMNCFGVAANMAAEQSCDPATGQLGPAKELPVLADEASVTLPGSWPPAQERPCAGEVPPEMVCVPGGVFLLGSPDDVLPGISQMSARMEHVVQLSPFALDTDEVTVGQVRALVNGGAISGEPLVRSDDPRAPEALCTYLGADVADHDAYPANCLDAVLASEVCAALGKRLPTEAEWEYAAGNTWHESRFPWGDDANDLCDRAIVERGRSALEAAANEYSWCRTSGASGTRPAGPVAGGSDQDVTMLGIRNMSGNVSEWVADRFEPYSGSCWNGTRVLVDPTCPFTQDDPHVSARGSSWAYMRIAAAVFVRGSAGRRLRSASVGVRCASSP